MWNPVKLIYKKLSDTLLFNVQCSPGLASSYPLVSRLIYEFHEVLSQQFIVHNLLMYIVSRVFRIENKISWQLILD